MVGTTNFPGSLDSHSGGDPFGFAEVANLKYSALTADATAGATTLTVTSTTGFATRGTIVCGLEEITYTGTTSTTFTGCTRGAGGTTAAAHLSGSIVGSVPVAANHNDLAAGLVAVQTAMGARLAYLTRKNRVINGCFRLAQRAMPTTDDQYCLDRWVLLLEAANAATVSQETSDVPTDGSKYGLKLTVGSGEDNKFGVVTIMEYRDVSDLRGKTVSLQAKLKATAAITDVRMAVLEWTGTADSVTSDVVGTWGSAGTNPTLATSWAYLGTPANLSVTTSWATYRVEGLTVGASANNLAVLIWCEDESTTVTTDILRITDVQLEEGPTCSGYERRPFAQEVNLCMRYYRKNIALGTSPATANQAQPYIVWTTSIANNDYYVDVSLDPPMRAAPTATTFPYTTPANTGRSSDGSGTDYGASSASVPVTTAGRFAIQNQSGGALTVAYNKLVHVGWTADAEL